MNGGELVSSTTTKPTLFPFLHKEVTSANSETINSPFLGGPKSKRAAKEPKLTKDAFPPSKLFRNPQSSSTELFTAKNLNNKKQRKAAAKIYSCPSIVDMNNTIFCHNDVQKRDQPRRIIDGFFPNKIRSSTVNGATIQHSYRTPMQADLFLGAPSRAQSVVTESTKVKIHGPQGRVQRPESIFTNNGNIEEHFNIRQSYSAWPVRNGSPSPWLERYKIKKRASTSYALQKPLNYNKNITQSTKRNQEYVNLSCAVILGAF